MRLANKTSCWHHSLEQYSSVYIINSADSAIFLLIFSSKSSPLGISKTSINLSNAVFVDIYPLNFSAYSFPSFLAWLIKIFKAGAILLLSISETLFLSNNNLENS